MSDEANEPITILNVKQRIDRAWNELGDLLKQLTPE